MFFLINFSIKNIQASEFDSSKDFTSGIVLQDNVSDCSVVAKLSKKVDSLQKLIQAAKPAAGTITDSSYLVLSKFSEIFKFVVDKCDKLTSKKFIIAAAITIGPLVALYCKYFDAQPLMMLMDKFFSFTSKGAADAGTAFAKGAVKGTVSSALDNKLALLGFAGFVMSAYAGWQIFKHIVIKVAEKIGERAALHFAVAAATA